MKSEQSAAKLLLSVSAIGMAAMSPANAQSGMWISIEGGAADFSIEGNENTFSSDRSFAIQTGVQIGDSPYSIGLGFRHSSGDASYANYGEYAYDTPNDGVYKYYNEYGEYDRSWTTLDLEVGKDISLGQRGTGRLTLGVRYVSADVSYSYMETKYYTNGYTAIQNYYSYGVSSHGIGPRIGFEGSMPIAERVSLDFEAGAAVLFGETSFSYTAYSIYEEAVSLTLSESATMTNLDFSAALSYMMSPNAKVSLGYRYERMNLSDETFTKYDNREEQGAFLRLTSSF